MNQKSRIEVRNLTKFFILALLKSKESVTGYYILKRLEKDLEKTASPTYVYDFLKKLKNEGYIENVPNLKSKRTKGYRLTTSGEKFTDSVFSRFDNIINAAIESKLKICASCGVKLYQDYHTETIDGKTVYFCCVHCAKAYKNH
ncbi:MAG: helix-turn-helix transcriptional regulator [Promethearchaeota archaeon]